MSAPVPASADGCAPSPDCQCRCHQPGMNVSHVAPCCSGIPASADENERCLPDAMTLQCGASDPERYCKVSCAGVRSDLPECPERPDHWANRPTSEPVPTEYARGYQDGLNAVSEFITKHPFRASTGGEES